MFTYPTLKPGTKQITTDPMPWPNAQSTTGFWIHTCCRWSELKWNVSMLSVSGKGEVAVDGLDQAQGQDCRLLNAGLVSTDFISFCGWCTGKTAIVEICRICNERASTQAGKGIVSCILCGSVSVTWHRSQKSKFMHYSLVDWPYWSINVLYAQCVRKTIFTS